MDRHRLYGETELPAELDARVRSELQNGERVLWAGQPDPALYARQGYVLMVFGIFFTGFALFWIATASGMLFSSWHAFADHDMPGGFSGGFGLLFSCFPLFGLPFVAVGLGMLSAPYWMQHLAKRTLYALTNRRAILWQSGLFGSMEVRSYGPADLTKLHRTEHSNGSGDLVFKEFIRFGRSSNGHATRHTTRYGFLAIKQVREVEDLLRKTLLSEGDKK